MGLLLLFSSPDETIRAAMVNSFAETPPMVCFPIRKRDDEWQPTGDHAQVVYDWAQEKRSLISSDVNPAKLGDPSLTPVGAFVPSPPSGWSIWESAPVLDNAEAGWKVFTASRIWALVRPWHGFFALLLSEQETVGAGVSIDCGLDHIWHRAYVKDGEIWTGRTGNRLLIWLDANTGIAGASCCIRVQRRRRSQTIWLAVESGGNIVLYESSDGLAWALSATFGTGTNPQIVVALDNIRFLYWCEAGGIKGVILDAAGNVVEAEFTAIATADDEPFGVDEGIADGKSRAINILCAVSGVLTLYRAPDGKTFS